MKSSTIRRSTLSKETMEVIENLAKEQEENGLPGEYVRPYEIEAASSKDKDSDGMSQEIDLLWQNFKTTQFNTNSPVINIMIGVVIGVTATLLVIFCIGAFSNENASSAGKSGASGIQKVFSHKNQTNEPTLEQQTGVAEQIEASENTAITAENEEAENAAVNNGETAQSENESAETADTSNMTKYTVKNGDTVEKIIKNHYGSYSPEKAEMIRKVNNMQTLDRISIDQVLLLP